MKKLVMALLLMAGISQAGLVAPTVPDGPPLRPDAACCDDIFTMYFSPTDTIAQVDVLQDGLVLGTASALPMSATYGQLDYDAPAVGDYSFRIYNAGPTVAGSSFWDSNPALTVGCVEFISFGAEQTVIPEPAALGLIVLCGIGTLGIRRVFMI